MFVRARVQTGHKVRSPPFSQPATQNPHVTLGTSLSSLGFFMQKMRNWIGSSSSQAKRSRELYVPDPISDQLHENQRILMYSQGWKPVIPTKFLISKHLAEWFLNFKWNENHMKSLLKQIADSTPGLLILQVRGRAWEFAFLRLMLMSGLETTLGVSRPPGPFHLLKFLTLYLTELLLGHADVRTGSGAEAATKGQFNLTYLLHMCSQIVSEGKNDPSKPLLSQGYKATGQQPVLPHHWQLKAVVKMLGLPDLSFEFQNGRLLCLPYRNSTMMEFLLWGKVGSFLELWEP